MRAQDQRQGGEEGSRSQADILLGKTGAPLTGGVDPAAGVVGKGCVASAVVAVPMLDLRKFSSVSSPKRV